MGNMMIKVIYTDPSGKEHNVDVADGASVMAGAVSNAIPGIVAECGGSCSCATCHVHIDPEWVDRVGPAEGQEASILDFLDDVDETSRLSCQVKLNAELDGLKVVIPLTQG